MSRLHASIYFSIHVLWPLVADFSGAAELDSKMNSSDGVGRRCSSGAQAPNWKRMAKEEKITLDAEVTEALPDARFKVKLENDQEILAYVSGKMRKFFIRILPGDRVTVEMSPYDMTKGRIVYRH